MCHYAYMYVQCTHMYVQCTYRILHTCFGHDACEMLLNPGSHIPDTCFGTVDISIEHWGKSYMMWVNLRIFLNNNFLNYCNCHHLSQSKLGNIYSWQFWRNTGVTAAVQTRSSKDECSTGWSNHHRSTDRFRSYIIEFNRSIDLDDTPPPNPPSHTHTCTKSF